MVGKPNEIPKEVEEKVLQEISYNPLTGEFTWKKPGRGRRRNGRAGSPHSAGYTMIYIRVNGVSYNILAHRLAWFMSYGVWPESLIDHINGEKDDNRLINLRAVTSSQNSMNKGKYLTHTQTYRRTITHGVFVGVDQMKGGRWRATCARKYLGMYDTPEEAALAYNKEALRRFGECAVLNEVDLPNESCHKDNTPTDLANGSEGDGIWTT